MTDYEIGRCTSRPLTEVRTVLSRAETALQHWSSFDALVVVEGEYVGHYSGRDDVDDYGYIGRVAITPHPDVDEMREALEKVVELLSPWRRTGRPKRRREAA